MANHIALIQGHPDPTGGHLCHALADAYAEGAAEAGHEVRRIDIATLDFPLLRSQEDFNGPPPDSIRPAMDAIKWADHLVIIYPLWLGTMPAMLKGFLEQALRPGFAIAPQGSVSFKKLLGGRSARIVVTMGMPGWAYRWFFGAHSLKSLERNILKFCGIGPIRETLIGMVEARSDHASLLTKLRKLGQQAI